MGTIKEKGWRERRGASGIRHWCVVREGFSGKVSDKMKSGKWEGTSQEPGWERAFQAEGTACEKFRAPAGQRQGREGLEIMQSRVAHAGCRVESRSRGDAAEVGPQFKHPCSIKGESGMYFRPLTFTLKMVNFMLCIFHYNKKYYCGQETDVP